MKWSGGSLLALYGAPVGSKLRKRQLDLGRLAVLAVATAALAALRVGVEGKLASTPKVAEGERMVATAVRLEAAVATVVALAMMVGTATASVVAEVAEVTLALQRLHHHL